MLDDLAASARDGFREAWEYTRAIPRSEMRLRLACAWPMLIGLRTLERIRHAETLLDPAVTVKIPRTAVYGVLCCSAALVWSNAGLGGYCRALDRRLDGGWVGR